MWVGNEQTKLVGEPWQRNLQENTQLQLPEGLTPWAVISIYPRASILLNGNSRKTSGWTDVIIHILSTLGCPLSSVSVGHTIWEAGVRGSTVMDFSFQIMKCFFGS